MKLAVFAVMLTIVYGHNDSRRDRDEALVDASTDFTQRLLLKVANDKKSMVLSPLSIHASLSMVLAGARTETAEEMGSILNVSSIPDVNDAYHDILTEYESIQDGELNITTIILVHRDLHLDYDYRNLVENKYFAEVWPFDVRSSEAVTKLNEYMKERTEGQIKDMINEDNVDSNTAIIVVNALTLKATWQERFSESKTRKQEFTCQFGNKIEVDMMNDTRVVPVKRDNESDADVVSIPFKGDRFALYAIIPRRYDGLPALELSLTQPGALENLLDNLKPENVELCLPKFKIETVVDLEDGLRDMGMKKPFNPDVADFSGINGYEGLHITMANHSAVIDIDENGTLTAGATAVEGKTKSTLLKMEKEEEAEEKITADKPFLFVVRDNKNKQILIQGKFTGEYE